MHTIKLNVADNAYAHLMFLLKNLKTDDIKIVEDRVLNQDNDDLGIDMSNYKIESFKAIVDPLKWQQNIRDEWN